MRLTSLRCNGIKHGYWSAAKKEDLVQRLAAYENTGLEPEEVKHVKHGHWKKCVFVTNTEDPEKSYWIVKCSLCCLTFDMKHTYCPNCGAKMDEAKT